MKPERRRLFLSIIIFVAVLVGVAFGAYKILNRTVKNIVIQSLDELAKHDMRQIYEYLSDQWNNLEMLCDELEYENPSTQEETLKKLNVKVTAGHYDHMYLVDSDGCLYSDTYVYYEKEDNAFWYLFESGQEQFALRYDDDSHYCETRKEYLMYGINFGDEPMTIAGHTYIGAIAMTDISAIQNRLRIQSFDGQGFSSVVNNWGYYIVNIERTAALNQQQNFFDKLDESTFDDGLKADDIKKLLAQDEEFEFTMTDSKGVQSYVMVKSMDGVPWNFVTSIETSVFSKQTMTFIVITMCVVVILLIALGVVMIVYSRAHKKLKKYYASVVDGVYSRKYYDDKLAYEDVCAFAIVDLDHLKQINDTFGHLAGDLAIEKIANILLKNMGTFGDVVRYGGDEFVLAFKSSITAEHFGQRLEGMINEVAMTKLDEYPDAVLTASIGGCYQKGVAGDLFTKADCLLYAAKKTRNCVVTDVNDEEDK